MKRHIALLDADARQMWVHRDVRKGSLGGGAEAMPDEERASTVGLGMLWRRRRSAGEDTEFEDEAVGDVVAAASGRLDSPPCFSSHRADYGAKLVRREERVEQSGWIKAEAQEL